MSPRRLITPSWWSAHMLGVALIALALCSVSVTWYAATEQRRVTACQAEYNDQFIAALVERNAATAADRRALIDLTNTILTATKRGDVRTALERYNAVLRATDAKRAEHPLPTNPICS